MQVNEVSNRIVEAIREGPALKQESSRPPSKEFKEKAKTAQTPQENFKGEALDPKKAKEMVFAVQEELEKLNVRLVFNVDEETKEIVVKVVDPKTNEVIRQIPPEELLEIRKKLDEIVGILFDVRV